MVGDEVGTSGSPVELNTAELTAGVRAGYDAAAQDWADGPGPMYAQLARVLVAAAPVPLAGRLVLDLGAGAGVAGRAALAAGARRVVAVDLSEGMLRCGAGGRPVAADAVALPFRDGSFDLVVAAFCLNHLDSLAVGLAEARRVGGALAASMFAPGWTHPAKDAVDDAVRSFGYRRRPGTRPWRLARDDWAEGTGLMYAQLARVLVAAAPVPLVGRLVLDLGAGVGVAGRAALAAGARRVVAVDLPRGCCGTAAGGTRSRRTRSRCRSVTPASTWWWRRSASTTWAASLPG